MAEAIFQLKFSSQIIVSVRKYAHTHTQTQMVTGQSREWYILARDNVKKTKNLLQNWSLVDRHWNRVKGDFVSLVEICVMVMMSPYETLRTRVLHPSFLLRGAFGSHHAVQ